MIRIFVGCAANWEDAESQAVLEYTLRKHASEPLEITWMKLSRDPESPFFSDIAGGGWNTSQWPTPFSGLRWAVPELCDFEGRAIYVDSDFIFLADVAELWRQAFMPGKAIIAKTHGRLCLSMWDCARAKKFIPPLSALRPLRSNHQDMQTRIRQNAQLVQVFKNEWNCLDGEGYADLNNPEIKAIHYTSMSHQPHLPRAVARLKEHGVGHWFDGEVRRHWRDDICELFDKLLNEAISAGYSPERYETGDLYGPYRKRSVARQGETIPHWGRGAAA